MTARLEIPIAVASRSFCRNPTLRSELLQRYADVKFNDEGKVLSGDGLVEFLRGRVKAIIGLEVIDEAVLSRLPELRIIGKYGVGLDMLDLKAMKRHGVLLGWTGGVNKRSVSELALCFMIAALRELPAAGSEMRAGIWKSHGGRLLSERTVGVIGCGHIGKDLVRLLQPFGCRVLAHDILDFPEFYSEFNVTAVTLDELLWASDVVTLHVPLDHRTRGLIGAREIALMKDGAVLVNTARGGLVDEAAAKAALKAGKLASAAFDVFATEPPDDYELLDLPGFLATPHVGGSSAEAVLAMGRAAIAGLDDAVEADQIS